MTEELRQLVRRFTPAWKAADFTEATPLGSDGLGLDSIAIVELLVACERQFGEPFPDSLLDRRPLTVGTLMRHLDQVRPPREGC
jgi:acyl carrier protein